MKHMFFLQSVAIVFFSSFISEANLWWNIAMAVACASLFLISAVHACCRFMYWCSACSKPACLEWAVCLACGAARLQPSFWNCMWPVVIEPWRVKTDSGTESAEPWSRSRRCTKSCSPVYSKCSEARLITRNREEPQRTTCCWRERTVCCSQQRHLRWWLPAAVATERRSSVHSNLY